MSSSTQTTAGISNDNDDYGDFTNSSSRPGNDKSHGLRRWSRNLSAQRHRELDRLNQIERRRQFLELRRQNDLFDQMSVTVNGPVDKATTIPLDGASNASCATSFSPNKRDSNEPRDSINQPGDTGPAAARTTSSQGGQGNKQLQSASGKEGPSKVNSHLDELRLTSPSSPDETDLERANDNNKGKAVELAEGVQGLGALSAVKAAHGIQFQEHEQQRQRRQQQQQQQQQQQGDRLAGDENDIRSSDQFIKTPITSQQLARFVSSRVPENKRVLCLIVRDKMSRLNKAKSYFYPTYYLFIQAIVDIDDTIASEQGSNHQVNLSGGDNENVTVRGPTSVDNSFSASSSISADMLFIGANGGENGGSSGGGAHLSSMKMLSGNSYSDNEIYAGTETDDDNNNIPTTSNLKTKARLTTKQVLMNSAGSLQGRDSPLVFPNRSDTSNNNCDASERGSSIGGARPAASKDLVNIASGSSNGLLVGAPGVRVENELNSSCLMIGAPLGSDSRAAVAADKPMLIKGSRGKVLMNTRSKLSVEDSRDEDGDDIDDDDYEDSDNDELNRKRWINVGNEEVNHNSTSTTTTTSNMAGATFSSPATTTTGIGIGISISNDHENMQQSWFDNERNPYTGTYGVLLAGRRRKKAKTYLIGLNEYGYTRKNSICKLKSNVLGTQFNAIRLINQADNNDRCNIASISYETNVLGFKGPRKMRVFLPKDPGRGTKNLSETFKKNPPAVVQLKNMTPSWNVESQSYVLNFHGRVTQASVKNFQLIESEMDYFGSGDGTQRGSNNNNQRDMLTQNSSGYMDNEHHQLPVSGDVCRSPMENPQHLQSSADYRQQGFSQQQAATDEVMGDPRIVNALSLNGGGATNRMDKNNSSSTGRRPSRPIVHPLTGS